VAEKLLQVVAGERRSEARDDVGHGMLMERDDVHVTFYDHETADFAHGQCLEQAVQLAALVKHLGLRRIQIFRLPLVDDTAAETDDPAATIVNREHDAIAKAVVEATAVTLDHEACALEAFVADAVGGQRFVQIAPTLRREADPEPFGDFAGDPAAPEIRNRAFSVGRAAQLLLEMRARAFEHVVELACSRGLVTARLARDLDTRHGGELFDGLEELEIAVLHQEADGGAVCAAAETVEELLLAAHRERGALLGVERAQGLEIPSGFTQRQMRLDQIDDVDPRNEIVDELLGEASGHGCRLGPGTGRRGSGAGMRAHDLVSR